MRGVLIHSPRASLPRAQAIAQGLFPAVGACVQVCVEGAFPGNTRQTDLSERFQNIVHLDPDPRAIRPRAPEDPPAVYIYSSGYGRAASREVMARHKEAQIPCLWERIRPAIEDDPLAGQVLLPPDPPSPGNAGKPESRNLRPLVAILSPPLEHEECRLAQKKYYARPKRPSSLLILRPSARGPELAAKIRHTNLWYVPKAGPYPVWSFELTTILFQGGRIACADPHHILRDYLIPAETYDQAEEALDSAKPRKTPDEDLYRTLSGEFAKTLDKYGRDTC